MINVASFAELSLAKTCVTIGSFDGIHLGHQKLITNLVSKAHEQDIPAVVVTFFPNPAVIIKKINSPYYISSPKEKESFLQELGVDFLVTIAFTQELATLTSHEFMDKLIHHLGLKYLIVGQGFVLGKDRQGSVDVLNSIGQEKGFEVLAVGSEIHHAKQISSSQIRQLIQNGEVDEAAKLLGRFFQVQGIVEKGDSRGRTIGFPTANLAVWPHKLIPASGVYRCFTKIEDLPRLSVTNIGYRPTFADDTGKVFVEVHILDFDGDLYGKELQVQFTHRLRGEIKFPSFEGLVRQIQSDIVAARNIP